MAGNILQGYQTSTTLTTTNLQSLASSQDWLAGWGSATITNTSALNNDFLLGFTFTTHASNRQAGVINIYIVPALDSTPTYPAVSSGTAGTEGAIAFTDAEERDAACLLLRSLIVDNTASAVFSVAAYVTEACKKVPGNFFIFVSQNCTTTTTAGFAAAGSVVKHTGQYATYT
jgi:hypothetical protein